MEPVKSYVITAYLDPVMTADGPLRRTVFSITLSCSHADVKDVAMHTFNNIERTMHSDSFMLDGKRATSLVIKSVHHDSVESLFSLDLHITRPVEIHEACAPVGWGRVIV